MAQIYNWTGFYVGVNGGWQFQHVSEITTFTPLPLLGYSGAAAAAAGIPTSSSSSSSSDRNAALAGGQLGFNWQYDWAVFGIEGEFDWTNENSTQVVGPSLTIRRDRGLRPSEDVSERRSIGC